MGAFVILLTSTDMFAQWSAVDSSDVLWLLPWLFVIALLTTTVRILLRALAVLASGVAFAFVGLVAYYLVVGV